MTGTQIFILILVGLAAVALLSLYLLAKIFGKEKALKALDDLTKWSDVAVRAAEQLFGEGSGAQKYEYASMILQSLGTDLSSNQIKAIIESSVKALKAAGLETEATTTEEVTEEVIPTEV